ncbi:hypothetical protein ATANTOWER_023689, partial [Ataeniobius toweri]|nr:hypothetical protein [Ataeniobius toweri]
MSHQNQPIVHQRTDPTERNTDLHINHCDPSGVKEWVTDGHIAIYRYKHHVAQSGRDQRVKGIRSQSTHQAPQQPACLQVPQPFDGHHQQPHRQVRHSQGQEQGVGRAVQLPEVGDGDDDKQVEHYSEQGDESQQC